MNSEVTESFNKTLDRCWGKLNEIREIKKSGIWRSDEIYLVNLNINELIAAYKKKYLFSTKSIISFGEKYKLLNDTQNRINSIIEYGQIIFDLFIEAPILEIEDKPFFEEKWLIFCPDK